MLCSHHPQMMGIRFDEPDAPPPPAYLLFLPHTHVFILCEDCALDTVSKILFCNNAFINKSDCASTVRPNLFEQKLHVAAVIHKKNGCQHHVCILCEGCALDTVSKKTLFCNHEFLNKSDCASNVRPNLLNKMCISWR